jgi:hypothetical protein
MKKKTKVGVLFLLLMISVLPVFVAQAAVQTAEVKPTGVKAILQPTATSLAEVSKSLPKLGVLLLILVIGALVAVGIAALTKLILEGIKLEKGAKKINIPEILKKGGIGLSLTDLLTEVIFFVLIIATLITALEFYGIGTSAFTSQVLAYIPQVISAMFILILGILVAILISGIIKLVGGNVKIAQSETLGNIAKYAIIITTALIALKELGLGVVLTDKSKDIILAGIVLALALGAKEKAGKFIDELFKK